MDRRRVIVLEKRHRWVPELRRQWADEGIEVEGCRSVGDLTASCGSPHPAHLVILDVDSDPGACLMFLGRRLEQAVPLTIMALVSPATSDLEWSLRELGVASVMDSRSDGGEIARVCRRLLRVVRS